MTESREWQGGEEGGGQVRPDGHVGAPSAEMAKHGSSRTMIHMLTNRLDQAVPRACVNH